MQERIGAEGVAGLLRERLELPASAIERALALSAVVTPDARAAVGELETLGVSSPLLERGIEELLVVADTLESVRPGRAVVDLSIARGFDYYTGTVYEGRHQEFPEIGSICSGGRYDDLAGASSDTACPAWGSRSDCRACSESSSPRAEFTASDKRQRTSWSRLWTKKIAGQFTQPPRRSALVA